MATRIYEESFTKDQRESRRPRKLILMGQGCSTRVSEIWELNKSFRKILMVFREFPRKFLGNFRRISKVSRLVSEGFQRASKEFIMFQGDLKVV